MQSSPAPTTPTAAKLAAVSARTRELEDENSPRERRRSWRERREWLDEMLAGLTAGFTPRPMVNGPKSTVNKVGSTPREPDGTAAGDDKHAKIMEHQLLRLQKRVKELEIANKELEITNSELSEFAGGEVQQQLQVSVPCCAAGRARERDSCAVPLLCDRFGQQQLRCGCCCCGFGCISHGWEPQCRTVA